LKIRWEEEDQWLNVDVVTLRILIAIAMGLTQT
jgi:hypothetical protein